MKYLYIFSAFIFCFQDCGSCDPTPTSCERTFQFEIPFFLSPVKDTFHINDTIWLESKISDLLIDDSTGEKINVKDFDFMVRSGFGRIDVEGYDQSANNFEVINIEGTYKVNVIDEITTVINVLYETLQDEKHFKAALVMKNTGVYHISFTNIATNLEENVNLINEDCLQKISLSYLMNNGEENNFYLEQYNVNEVPSLEVFKRAGAYNFVVIN